MVRPVVLVVVELTLLSSIHLGSLEGKNCFGIPNLSFQEEGITWMSLSVFQLLFKFDMRRVNRTLTQASESLRCSPSFCRETSPDISVNND